MSSHGEGQSGLFRSHTIHSCHDDRGCIEDRGQRAQPGLIVMLRTEETESPIREMAFQHLCRPMLPVPEDLIENGLLGAVTKPSKQLHRSRW